MTVASPVSFTPRDVEVASKRDGKRYELIDGELKEKVVGTRSLFIASRICERLNAAFYPNIGFAAVEAMIYCFAKPRHGRKPDVSFVRFERLGSPKIPEGDLFVAPDLVVEVLSPGNTGIEVEDKLDEYLEAGMAMVWIVNPEPRTIRVYRQDGTTRLFRAADAIENELVLPGFRLVIGEVFPQQ
ncbi:MAG TPA: Uma2 family endonuclease [Tepidisphaeraceae bacterium]|jgi:Uma2 family endonuclease|nr:Uma2 family endonuclease [Tepidisphaeraceae bacterium]